MEIQERDFNVELDYEEIKRKLAVLEEENRRLQQQTSDSERGLAETGRLLLSSFRPYNVYVEVAKHVTSLLKISENLEKTLAKSAVQLDYLRVLEKEVDDLNEKLIEVKSRGFPFSIWDSFKEWKESVTRQGLSKTISIYLGPTSHASAGSVCNFVIGVTVSHLWNAISFGLNTPGALPGLQGAVLACLLLKFMSDEKEKLALQELPGSSKVVLQGISSYLREIEPITMEADKLDQVLHKGLGMSLFSEEFREFCLQNKSDSTQDSRRENVNKFIFTLSSDIRQNVIKIQSDEELKKPLEQLEKVVWNGTFLRANALYQACKLIEALPSSYRSKCDNFVLDAVQYACHQVLPEDNLESKSNLVEMAAGIVKMRNDYKKITDLYSFSDEFSKPF